MDIAKLVQTILEIAESQARIEAKQDAILEALRPDTMTRKVIARELGRSTEWIRTHPWALPNYSVPDVSGPPDLWHRATWQEWNAHQDENKQRWNAMTPAERGQVLKFKGAA